SYLLTYRTSDGRAALWQFRPGGWGLSRVWVTQWRYGWDRITPLFLEDDSYLQFYDAIGGIVATAPISATDHGRVTICGRGTIRANITRFVPFIRDRVPYVLTYDEANGVSVI